MDRYLKCREYWDEVFSKHEIGAVATITGNEKFDRCLEWAFSGSETVVDFGCGNGMLLFIAEKHGTRQHIGIDISQAAISAANTFAKKMYGAIDCTAKPSFCFMQGSVEKLMCVGSNFCDTVIVSNIIDNLYPDDAEELIDEVYRILKPNGKVFVKLNSFISEKLIREWNIKKISGNLLDDGLILWNNSTEEWEIFFSKRFKVVQRGEIEFPEYEQINRYFLLRKNADESKATL